MLKINKGMDRLIRSCKNIQKLDTDKVLEEHAKFFSGELYRRTPVDTGRLRRSIKHERETLSLHSVHVETPYAAYVEYGTRKMAARLYFTRSVQITSPYLKKSMGKAIRVSLNPGR